jgi:hypothetical protein
VWTEAQAGVGAVNFITGAGGFLQAVFFGYSGLRLTMSELEIKPPARLPNRSSALVLHGLKYYGATFDLTIESGMYRLHVRVLDGSDAKSLVYEHSQSSGTLKVDDVLSFPVDTRLIIRPATPLCP